MAFRDELRTGLTAFLKSWLPDCTDVEVTTLSLATEGGSRENWIVEAKWRAGEKESNHRLVLRCPGQVRVVEPSDEMEFQVIQALHAHAPFPVPAALCIESSIDWIGRPFMLLEWLPGSASRFALVDPDVPIDTRVSIAQQWARAVGQLHALDWRSAGLSTLDAPANVAAAADTAIEISTRHLRRDPRRSPVFAHTLHWLRQRHPQQGPITLVHGDLRPGNIMSRGGHMTAVLDWELARLSDPAEDLGWLTIGGYYDKENFIPGRFELADFYAEYQAASGLAIDEERLRFWRVVCALRLWDIGVAREMSGTETQSPGSLTGRLRNWNTWHENLLVDLMGL